MWSAQRPPSSFVRGVRARTIGRARNGRVRSGALDEKKPGASRWDPTPFFPGKLVCVGKDRRNRPSLALPVGVSWSR